MPVDCIKTFYQEHKSNKKNLSFWKISKYGLSLSLGLLVESTKPQGMAIIFVVL